MYIKWAAGIIAFGMISCGNARDGDPATDTTTFSTESVRPLGDSSFNTNTGRYSQDTMNVDQQTPDVNSSTATPSGSRKTTPGADSAGRK